MYDPSCYDLACQFLDDPDIPNAKYVTERHKSALAQIIQDAIEDFMSEQHLPTEEEGRWVK